MNAGLRTLRLVEYQPRDVRLRRADVDALLAGGAVEIVPTRARHRYRLTARGVAGILRTPELRVVIRPKIPAANLYLLLDPDAPPEVLSDLVAPEPGTEAFDFLARRLGDAMRTRAARGLPRNYIEQSDQQSFLQGRLDVAAQIREQPPARAQFHVTRDEFTRDTSVHRQVRAVAEAVAASPFLSSSTRPYLRSALAGYADITAVPVDPAALATSHAEADRPVIDLCRLLIAGLRLGERPGDVAGPAFLLDLERMFERYVERGLHSIAGLEVQREFCYHDPVPAGQPVLTGRPDFVVRGNGRPICVIDAKWKSLDGPPPPGDVQQALAYAAGLGCRDVRLVYPGRRDGAWRYDLAASAVTLTVHSLRVVGPRDRCERSVRRLREAIARVQ